MKNKIQEGFISYMAVIVVLAIIAGLVYYFLTRNNQSAMIDNEKMVNDEFMMEEEAMMKEGGEMMEGGEIIFTGKLLAGSLERAPLLDFTKSDYDKALASGKLVTLYFYANWCPICREEFPKMQKVFSELETDGVIGFRVNYNDNETDKDEQGLAREFGVAYQHTKVFVKGGTRLLKSPEGWSESRYKEEINRLIN